MQTNCRHSVLVGFTLSLTPKIAPLQDGWRPLHFAAYGGSEKAAAELISHGADVRATDQVLFALSRRFRSLALSACTVC